MKKAIFLTIIILAHNSYGQKKDTSFFNPIDPTSELRDSVGVYSLSYCYEPGDISVYFQFIGYTGEYNWQKYPIYHGDYITTIGQSNDTITKGQFKYGLKAGYWYERDCKNVKKYTSRGSYNKGKKEGQWTIGDDEDCEIGSFKSDKKNGVWKSIKNGSTYKKVYYNSQGKVDSVQIRNQNNNFYTAKRYYYNDEYVLTHYEEMDTTTGDVYKLNSSMISTTLNETTLSGANLVLPKSDYIGYNSMVFSKNGKFAASIFPTEGRSFSLIDLTENKIIKNVKDFKSMHLSLERADIVDIALSNDGKFLLYTQDLNSRLLTEIWDLDKEKKVDSISTRYYWTSKTDQNLFLGEEVLLNRENDAVFYNWKAQKFTDSIALGGQNIIEKIFYQNDELIYFLSGDTLFPFNPITKNMPPPFPLKNSHGLMFSNEVVLSDSFVDKKLNKVFTLYDMKTGDQFDIKFPDKLGKKTSCDVIAFQVDRRNNHVYIAALLPSGKVLLIIYDLESAKQIDEKKLGHVISYDNVMKVTASGNLALNAVEYTDTDEYNFFNNENSFAVYNPEKKELNFLFRDLLLVYNPELKSNPPHYLVNYQNDYRAFSLVLDFSTLQAVNKKLFERTDYLKSVNDEKASLEYYNTVFDLQDSIGRGFYDPYYREVSGLLHRSVHGSATLFKDYESTVNLKYHSKGRFMTNHRNNGLLHLNLNKTAPYSQLVYLYLADNAEYIFLCQDRYYFVSENFSNNIYFELELETFDFEQFDLKYNRPDIILDRLGYADSSLIAAYHAAYKKRLKKMGFTEDMLKDDFHLPEIEIENFEKMPTIIDEGNIDLNLHLEDSKYKLDRINVWVNDVAIYGTDGISLRDLETQVLDKTIKVNLAKGQNKVQVSVLNQAGAESYKETFELECSVGKKKPDLYLITIGESEFQQNDFNLTYAAKDARDIASLFPKSKVYDEVFTKTLTNNQVTRENVVGLQSFLEKAGINDHVMVFLAGHGVLSADLDYYLATYDMDFAAPAKRGLMYEDLEGLLDGIKPLKKTLILDACHSGEIDKEEVELASAENTFKGDVQFRSVGKSVKSKLGAQNTLELTKSLFTDLRKGTGATVISSAGGMEFAMEGDDWNNGLFTYALLNGIESGEADLNNDKEIWLSELKEYVGQKVTELSNGKQQPTSRIENQTVDFRVW